MTDQKEWIGRVFDCAAEQYGKKSCSFFNYFGNRLAEQVPIQTHQHVLDIATGKGAVLFPIAEKVGPLGRAVGIDFSEQMIKETIKLAKEKGKDWIQLLQMDAEQLDFPDHTFDAVFCGFGLFFFPSILKALSEFKRVLKPGGFLAVSTWGDDSQLDKLVNQELNELCHTNNLTIHPLWTAKALQDILQTSGFKNIRIIEEIKEFQHKTAEEWWESLWAHGTRAKLEQLSSLQLAEIQKKLISKAMIFDNGHGILEDLHVFYGISQKVSATLFDK